jgi:cephalosporin-C deacetylase-like acetyl esterase
MRFSLCCLLLSGTALAAPPGPAPGDAIIDNYLRQETRRIGERFLDGARTREEWEARRPRLRREYLDMLGLWPLPERTPLHAAVTGTLERDGVVIEKLHYQSRPGLYVTANLYRPKEIKGRLPAVLYVCGHSGRGRDGNKTAFQDHGMWFASNGYVCLVVDTLQLGEVPGKHHGTYNLGRWWWQARGYTPAGVECWNGVRGLDYLCGRPDVDPGRLGVTGISGGGATTAWVAAADERIKCAAPVSGMSDLESYVSNKVINGHCDCMFLVNTYQWEWTTIAALVAPRPLLFANSDNDAIFPMDGNRRIVARLRQAYALYDKPELVAEHVSPGGHDYRPDLRMAVFRWMNKHLKGDPSPVKDTDFPPLPGERLRVFPTDKDVPADARNAAIDETFVPPVQVRLPEAKDFAQWKKGLLGQLREKSFRALPDPVPPMKILKSYNGVQEDLSSEPGTAFHGMALLANPLGEQTATLVVLGAEDDAFKEARRWGEQFADDAYSYAITPRGAGKTEWTRRSPPNYVERSLALLGQTADTGRLRDVLATLRAAAGGKKRLSWRVVGRGQAGILAAYAALFEPSVKEVVIIDPPTSHRDGPTFLNVLRVLDVPEALGLLAPTPLTLVNAKDKAFDRTEAIYKLAGAADKLKRK